MKKIFFLFCYGFFLFKTKNLKQKYDNYEGKGITKKFLKQKSIALKKNIFKNKILYIWFLIKFYFEYCIKNLHYPIIHLRSF